jgi:biopolymer transport protein ExbB/TolQ
MSRLESISRALPAKPSRRTLLALVAAAAATALTFLAVHLAAPPASYLRTLLFERSWIQPVTTLCFWITIAILAIKHLQSLRERSALARARELIDEVGSAAPMIWTEEETVRERFVDDSEARHAESLTFTRIRHALDRLRKTQSTRALEEYFRTRSEVDAGELETSYAGIRYLIWLIPTLGFIGTVLGIGVGIAGFASILEAVDSFQEIQTALPGVTQSLGTAFDTTLLALALSAIAVFTMSHVLQGQEQVLEEIDDLCIDQVCPLFQEHSTVSAEIVKAIQDKVDLIVQRNDGNRAQIEAVLRDDLPAVLGQGLTDATGRLEQRLGELGSRLEAAAQEAGRRERPETQPADGESLLKRLFAALDEIQSSQKRVQDRLEALEIPQPAARRERGKASSSAAEQSLAAGK